MSTTMPEANLKTVEYQGEVWTQVGDGSRTYTNGKERKNLGANGLPVLSANGNPGNSGGGRPAEKVRRDATDSLAEHVGKLGSMLGKTLAAAEAALDSGKLHDAMSMLNQASRAASTLTSIGPGTKVTNVVESPEWVSWTREAMEETGIGPELVTEALKRLEARLS